MEPINTSKSENSFSSSFRLSNINLEINPSELVCIIGEVGSGKSSLLNSILGEMWEIGNGSYFNKHIDPETNEIKLPIYDQKSSAIKKKSSSSIHISGSISYVQQDPWIQNKTIKENIISLDSDKE